MADAAQAQILVKVKASQLDRTFQAVGKRRPKRGTPTGLKGFGPSEFPRLLFGEVPAQSSLSQPGCPVRHFSVRGGSRSSRSEAALLSRCSCAHSGRGPSLHLALWVGSEWIPGGIGIGWRAAISTAISMSLRLTVRASIEGSTSSAKRELPIIGRPPCAVSPRALIRSLKI